MLCIMLSGHVLPALQTLRMLSPSVDRTECSSALLDENLSKNRIRNILPRTCSPISIFLPCVNKYVFSCSHVVVLVMS